MNTRISILQWIVVKLGTYFVLKRIWNPIDFQGHRSRSPDKIFRLGDMPCFALPLFCFVLFFKKSFQKLIHCGFLSCFYFLSFSFMFKNWFIFSTSIKDINTVYIRCHFTNFEYVNDCCECQLRNFSAISWREQVTYFKTGKARHID